MIKRILALGMAMLMAFPIGLPLTAKPAQADSGPLIPIVKQLVWRTQTDVGDPNDQGYIDSTIFRRGGAAGTMGWDTTAAFSLLDFVPEHVGIPADSATFITVAIHPSNNPNITSGSDSCNYTFEVSYNGRDWFSVAELIPIIDVSTTVNTSLRRINVTQILAAAGTPAQIHSWPLMRVIITNDHNGEFQGTVKGYGPASSAYKGKLVPLVFRTQTITGDPNDQGYIDSTVTSMTGAGQTDTTAAISTLEFFPDRSSAAGTVDTCSFFQLAIYPAVNPSLTTTFGGTGTFGLQGSFNGKDWTILQATASGTLDLLGNHNIRKFNVSRVQAIGTTGFESYPLIRFLFSMDVNGQVRASLSGYGPE